MTRFGAPRPVLGSLEAANTPIDAEGRAWTLRELREQLNLTQMEVATELGVSQNAVSRIERSAVGRIRVETLRRYAEALGGTLSAELQVGEDIFRIA